MLSELSASSLGAQLQNGSEATDFTYLAVYAC